ncbi:unnamed protein product, partial [Tetraodon nigroviridis]
MNMPLHQISVIPRDVTSSRVCGNGKAKDKDKQNEKPLGHSASRSSNISKAGSPTSVNAPCSFSRTSVSPSSQDICSFLRVLFPFSHSSTSTSLQCSELGSYTSYLHINKSSSALEDGDLVFPIEELLGDEDVSGEDQLSRAPKGEEPKTTAGTVTRASAAALQAPLCYMDEDSDLDPPLTEKSGPQSPYSLSGDCCRICHCEGDEGPLITPCHCTGSLRFVHQSCLQQWIKSSDTRCCELCKYEFIMETKLKPAQADGRIPGILEWPFWTKLVVVAIGFTGGLVFMYVQCKVYIHLWRRLKAYNRVIYVQNLPETYKKL